MIPKKEFGMLEKDREIQYLESITFGTNETEHSMVLIPPGSFSWAAELSSVAGKVKSQGIWFESTDPS